MRSSALHLSGPAISWLLLSGCAHTTRAPEPSPPEAMLVQLEVQVVSADGSRQPPRTLPLDDPKAGVRAGEDFALTLDLNAPGHLYVVRSGASGVTRLYPAIAASDAAHPAGKQRAPEGSAWLRVESLDTTDLLCIVTSQTALAPADLSCQDEDRGEDRSPPPPERSAEKPRDPPPPRKDTRRPDLLHVLPLPIHRGS